MPGPAPKPSSRRSAKGRGGLRHLTAVPTAKRPEWPLAPDAALEARREVLRDQVAANMGALDAEGDRRKRWRIKGKLEAAQVDLALVEIQIEQSKDAEAVIWADLWGAPQADLWAENPATIREVALYCRWMVRAEQGDTKAAAEARQLSNTLGINPSALLKLRVEIEHAESVEDRGRRRRAKQPATKSDSGDSRSGDSRDALFG